MTWLIDQFRMMFCKHEWKKDNDFEALYRWSGRWLQVCRFTTWHCTKCGYSKKVKV